MLSKFFWILAVFCTIALYGAVNNSVEQPGAILMSIVGIGYSVAMAFVWSEPK